MTLSERVTITRVAIAAAATITICVVASHGGAWGWGLLWLLWWPHVESKSQKGEGGGEDAR